MDEAGFADAGRAEQGDPARAVGDESCAHGGDVVVAADEWGELSRQELYRFLYRLQA